ncbi:lipoprotein [Oceanithermus sp.]
MKKVLVLLVLALVLAACAPRVWYKPGATSAMRDRDLQSCRYQAEMVFGQRTPPLSEFRVYVDVPYGTPLELARRVQDAAEEAVRREYEDYRSEFVNGFVHDCMTRKGYVLVEEE